MSTTHTHAQPFTTTTLGSARIGPRRELKKAVEGYWNGTTTAAELADVAAQLRRTDRAEQVRAGMDSVAVNTFSYYDQVLDTAVMLDALPSRFAAIDDPLDRYFAAARGTADVEPLEMTKWFDTNYHYLVPEISADTTFSLHPEKVLAEVDEAAAQRIPARPVLVGPATFLALSKATDDTDDLLDRLDELVPLYRDLLGQLAERGVSWVQLDEPILVTDLSDNHIAAITAAYRQIADDDYPRPAVLVATYFGDPQQSLAALAATSIDGFAVDLTATDVTTLTATPALASKLLVAGVVDGRNVWRTDLAKASATLASLLGTAAHLAVSTSCSTLHVPYSLDGEDIDPTIRPWLAFADDKRREVATLSRALRHGRDTSAAEFDESARVARARRSDPRLRNESIRTRIDLLVASGTQRGDADVRRAAQQRRLQLPTLPTTTIGSYPQTADIRRARAQLRTGAATFEDYQATMRAEIDAVIDLQERIGLDVLVHGEPERNDMVQYFADQLQGFVSTANGWVQSYGTRCVRPPIIYGDVVRPQPMTVDWISYAQSRTGKPVKGMLTGPVTIVAWSFVRDDQPLADTANQVALAIRDETVDLQNAGIGIIQVDEPALRELMPLRAADQTQYLRWSVESFRLATSGVADDTQIHTHLCYSEFGEVIDAIAALDADVTSIEAARSKMEVVADLNAAGFANEVGPGVYDIHSPRIPSVESMASALGRAVSGIGAQRLWVNPDCGLKTRTTAEVTAALENMVAAAAQVRDNAPQT